MNEGMLMLGSVETGTGKYKYINYSVVTDYIPVESASYITKLFNAGSIRIFRLVGYDEDKNYLFDDSNLDLTEKINVFNTTKYVRICYKKGNYETLTVQEVFNAKPYFAQGHSADTFKEYVAKKIMIKNKNGVFEKFIEFESDRVVSSKQGAISSELISIKSATYQVMSGMNQQVNIKKDNSTVLVFLSVGRIIQ
ncbi:MAG: hypothetical protein K6B70_01325 [Clostridia bacterium]|nr:hypothetical protein [Clostridia bacterium]